VTQFSRRETFPVKILSATFREIWPPIACFNIPSRKLVTLLSLVGCGVMLSPTEVIRSKKEVSQWMFSMPFLPYSITSPYSQLLCGGQGCCVRDPQNPSPGSEIQIGSLALVDLL
jgi:hypothetical protein